MVVAGIDALTDAVEHRVGVGPAEQICRPRPPRSPSPRPARSASTSGGPATAGRGCRRWARSASSAVASGRDLARRAQHSFSWPYRGPRPARSPRTRSIDLVDPRRGPRSRRRSRRASAPASSTEARRRSSGSARPAASNSRGVLHGVELAPVVERLALPQPADDLDRLDEHRRGAPRSVGQRSPRMCSFERLARPDAEEEPALEQQRRRWPPPGRSSPGGSASSGSSRPMPSPHGPRWRRAMAPSTDHTNGLWP